MAAKVNPAIRVFKSPSKLTVVVKNPVEAERPPMISDSKRGDTFMREGALCMRTDVSLYRASAVEGRDDVTAPEGYYWILNLQTGRTWASADVPIRWVKATVTLDGELITE